MSPLADQNMNPQTLAADSIAHDRSVSVCALTIQIDELNVNNLKLTQEMVVMQE